MGGINFDWLAVWVLSPDWLRYATFVRRLGEAAMPGGGEYRPCPDFALCTLAFALQQEKSWKNLSGCPKGTQLTSAERDSFSVLGHQR